MSAKPIHSDSIPNYDIPAFLRPEEVKSATEDHRLSSVLVVGVGGVGTEYVKRLSAQQLQSVDCVIADTDNYYISVSARERVGQRIREPDKFKTDVEMISRYLLTNRRDASGWKDFTELVRNYRIVVINAGLGGYSGSMLTPMIAHAVRQTGGLPIVHCSIPSHEERLDRQRKARTVIEELQMLNCYTLKHENELLQQYDVGAYRDPIELVFDLYDREIGLLAPIARRATGRVHYDEVRSQREGVFE